LRSFGGYCIIVKTNSIERSNVSKFLQQCHYYYYLFYLTTTSGRPEPECTLRRVISSEPIQDEQLTRDCKQTTNN